MEFYAVIQDYAVTMLLLVQKDTRNKNNLVLLRRRPGPRCQHKIKINLLRE
jgi:hypothetical protein